jgi:acetyltransferase-like isoleucine patch superfamily enzyme
MRRFGARVGHNVRVHPIRVMNAAWRNLTIEDDCYLGPDTLLDLADGLVIGRGAVLAARVSVLTHQDAGSAHASPTTRRVPTFHRPTHIGAFGFVGIGAIVLAGCDVGDGAVVGAGAVVTRPVPDCTTVTGAPAR